MQRVRLHADLQPIEPTEADPFDSVKAAHLLARAGFGGTPAEVARVMSLGPVDAAYDLLDFPDAPAEEQSKSDVPDLSGIEGYPKTFDERRRNLAGLTPEERIRINNQMMAGNREALFATAEWWMKRMASGKYPMQEKLTLFWHGHFTTSARDERSAWLMWQQNETHRRHAAGNFRAYVKAISRDPAMLGYLNNQQNRKGSPNENYARELMELFTLGIGNYTEQDIKEAARAFTGWHHDGEQFVFRRNQHDTADKTFMRRTGAFGGDEVIDIILEQDASAAYIASRVWNFFVADQIKPEHAASLGALLRENDYELRPLLITIFTSKAFYDRAVIGTQIKSPIQLIVGSARMMGIDLPRRARISGALEQMGQVPFFPPNVKGWPGGRTWINSGTLFVRYNTALMLANELDTSKVLEAPSKPGVLVQQWVDRLIQRPIDVDKMNDLTAAAGSAVTKDSAKRLIELIVSMPEYQLC
jgi:uncharacterized protein (DUF1800 family)